MDDLNKSVVFYYSLSFKDERFWELKEAAKWSLDIKERKRAISELTEGYGAIALPALSEIKDTTVYEEIRSACIEAIKSANRKNQEASKIIDTKQNQEPVKPGKTKRISKSMDRTKKERRR